MRKIILAFFAMVLITIAIYYAVVVFAIGTVADVVVEVDKQIDERKELIGEKFVVEKDTLLIVDYNGITGKYKVHGTETTYAPEFVEKNLIK